jgi:hypothetical protein
VHHKQAACAAIAQHATKLHTVRKAIQAGVTGKSGLQALL